MLLLYQRQELTAVILLSLGYLVLAHNHHDHNSSLLYPIVATKYGLIEGIFDGVSRDGKTFYSFRGIQYAVVKDRFKSSIEPSAWDGVKQAKEFGPVCYNFPASSNNENFSENCLYMNIWTSNLTATSPVVVYIHGGSFQSSDSSRYGPNYLLDEDQVYVTINYRLGILGFMSTGDSASPGNFGLKDQWMGLKYVQDNIHAFGGNKNLVTIMGQSAGGASVSYHLVSPLSRGLFHRAIIQSGTFLDPWAFTRKPIRYARKLAEHFNCSTENSSAFVDCLIKVPADAISHLDLARNLTVKFFEDPFAAFGPTIEPNSDESFLSTSPYELLVTGNVNKVPILTGIAKEEGIYIWSSYLLFNDRENAVVDRERLEADWNSVAPAAFYFDEFSPANRQEEIAEKVQHFYFGSDGFVLTKNSTFPNLSRLYSERLFVVSAIRFMNLYSKLAPTYPYLYTFNKFVGIEFGREELHNNYSLDATHAAELDMLMSPLFGQVRVDPIHDQLSKSITKLWTSFIKEGVPEATYGSERRFPAIQPDIGLQHWYKLDVDTELYQNIFAEGVSLWNSLELSDDDFYNCFC